jgi:putative redox protein
MSLSGCIGTIFAMVAQKMRIDFERMEVELDAQQNNGAPTVTDVHFRLSIKTSEDKSRIEKCLEVTENTCPVGVLYKQAGVKMTHEIIIL